MNNPGELNGDENKSPWLRQWQPWDDDNDDSPNTAVGENHAW